jgi:hypothetical protein
VSGLSVRRTVGWQPDSSHATFGSIAGSNEGGRLRDDFGYVGRSSCHIHSQGMKIFELVKGLGMEFHAVTILADQGQLQL